MSLDEIKEILRANGLPYRSSYSIYNLLGDSYLETEGIKGGMYFALDTACIAVKLFGARLKLTRILEYSNNRGYTPFIAYDSRRSKKTDGG